jgi:uncharacterized membrane protein YfcA
MEFILVGLFVGALSGSLGIGGAVVLIPILTLAFGFSQTRAQGTSIGALLPPVGLFAALAYYRQGLLDVRASGLIALGFVFGALGGASLVQYLPQIWLKRAFATLLIYVATQLIFAGDRKMGAVLPGVVASVGIWAVFLLRRALGKKAPPPKPPEPPPSDDIDYVI